MAAPMRVINPIAPAEPVILLKNPINNQLIDVVLQKDFAENIASSAASGDKKIAQDSKSDATLRFLANSTKNGLLDLYTDHLKNTIADLTPEELFAKFYGKFIVNHEMKINLLKDENMTDLF